MSKKLNNHDELLYRQIHPDLLDQGVPSSSNFKPRKTDKNRLSVDRSSMTSPSSAFALYTSNGLKSAAVYALSLGEFNAENIDCYEDPVIASCQTKGNPAHAIADFAQHNNNQQDKIAKRLKRKAITRGQLYPKVIDV